MEAEINFPRRTASPAYYISFDSISHNNPTKLNYQQYKSR